MSFVPPGMGGGWMGGGGEGKVRITNTVFRGSDQPFLHPLRIYHSRQLFKHIFAKTEAWSETICVLYSNSPVSTYLYDLNEEAAFFGRSTEAPYHHTEY